MIESSYATIIKTYKQKITKVSSGCKPRLYRLPGIKAVLFDVYGTLFLTESTLNNEQSRLNEKVYENLRRLIGKYHITYHVEGLLAAYRREIEDEHSRARLREPYPEVDIVRIWSRVLGQTDVTLLKEFALELEMIVQKVWPSGNLKALFSYLKNRRMRIGILSNAQFYTKLILEYFLKETLPAAGLDKELVLYSYQYGIAKPSVKFFSLAVDKLKQLGINAAEVLFIGNDIGSDILPARQAGFKTALFLGDKSSLAAANARENEADLVMTDWKQIKKII